MPDSELAIETHGLTKYFGSKRVVDGLDLKMPKGKIYGFLGRNGAGKSTTIQMLLGLLEPTEGSAKILGFDCKRLPSEARARIGYLPEGHPVYGWMTVEECQKFQRASYGSWNEELFQAVLDHFRVGPRQKAGSLSRGQRAGLCLAMVLAPEPELLILDDPALGLDPVTRRNLLEAMIFVTRKEGRTVLFSSHILADVERVADTIWVLHDGRLRASCSTETFRQRIRRVVLRFSSSPPAIPSIPGVVRWRKKGEEMWVTYVENGHTTLRELEQQLRPTTIEDVPLNLEDAFIDYVSVDEEDKTLLQRRTL